MARKRHRIGGVLRQATLDAEVKYSPEAFALSQLLGQARSDYSNQLKIERGVAAGVKNTARATLPKVKKTYSDAQATANRLNTSVAAKLAPLSAAADDIKAAAFSEAAGAQRRLGESRANAVNEIQQRISQADAARAYAVSNARQQYLSQAKDINEKIIELGREQGTYTAADAAALRKANRQYSLAIRGQNQTLKAAKLRVKATKRGQDLSHQDRAVANRIKQQNANKPKGSKAKGSHLTPGQQNAAIDQINQAVSFIKKLEANPKLNSHQIRQTLEQGYTVSSKGGKPGVKIPAFPHDIVNAAYDLFVFHHLSAPNVHALRRRKVKIPKHWLPTNNPLNRAADVAAGLNLGL